jgi:hypothetical protein
LRLFALVRRASERASERGREGERETERGRERERERDLVIEAIDLCNLPTFMVT